MAITINGTTGIAGVDGSAGTPAVQGTDTNTGIFFPAADTIAFGEGGAEVARFDSSGNLGIGTTSPASDARLTLDNGGSGAVALMFSRSGSGEQDSAIQSDAGNLIFRHGTASSTVAGITERARITSGGDLLVGKTASAFGTAGFEARVGGETWITMSASNPLYINRLTSDGDLVIFYQDTVSEGFISVSGTTVSYNGGHLARVSQMPNNSKDDTILKGTVLTNLDDMCEWTKDGEVLPNEQLNKVKVSDVEGDVNVAGVFVNWTYDEAHQVDEINMAMTGDMIIRIAQGVTVQKGDLLMSAGDGTAKPQGDDIVRSKTVAKVTSNHVTCTYADGSYCVPCVLMAC
jgi:hypothetical protein